VKTRIRREDCFARYGGEEFAIVLPEIDGLNAKPFAEKIRQLVEATEFRFENTAMPVTISMGVATMDAESIDPPALIKRADDRLYEAKSSGRNRVCA
jgi:two-component system cell cycle response regulator